MSKAALLLLTTEITEKNLSVLCVLCDLCGKTVAQSGGSFAR